MKKSIVAILMLMLIGGITMQAQEETKKKTKKCKKDYVVTISTEHGDMALILYKETPKHRENFLKLANDGFYDGTTFHRIIKDFMIQGGDPNSKDDNPNNDGQGGPGYRVDAEFNPNLYHKKGALAAARDNNPKKASSGCQFYIVQGKKFTESQLKQMSNARGAAPMTEAKIKDYSTIGGTPHLDMGYTVFGELISGMDVLDALSAKPNDARKGNRPLTPITMKVTVKKMSCKKIAKIYGYVCPC